MSTMKKTYDMTEEEYWRHLHSKHNLNGHTHLNLKEMNEAMPHARHLACCSDLSRWGKQVLQHMETINRESLVPELQPSSFQAIEWTLAQIVKEAADILKHTGELQEYLHGAKQANATICQLRQERRKALRGGGPYELRIR